MAEGLSVVSWRHWKPSSQPVSVVELTEALFKPFRVEGCSIALTGCLFEEVPFWLNDEGSRRRLFDLDGREVVDAKTLNWLTASLEPLEPAPPQAKRVDPSVWLRQTDVSLAAVPGQRQLVWARWAHGKLVVRSVRHSAEMPFQGWSTLLNLGETTAQPFRCSLTGAEGFDIVATDDDELTVRGATERCAVSGRVRVVTHLETCAATGRRVSSEFLVTCPVSDQRVLPESLDRCSVCHELVASTVVSRGVCAQCDRLEPLTESGWGVDWLQQHGADLTSWRWRWVTGKRLTTFVGRRWLQREVWVVDTETKGIIRRVAGRWRGRWRDSVSQAGVLPA